MGRGNWRAVFGGAALLYVELALIRYIPGQMRVLGYFTNFVLLGAFLGAGLGILARRRLRDRIALGAWAPFALLAVVGLAELGQVLQVVPSPADFLFLEYSARGPSIPVYPFLAISFVLIATSFVPLGYIVGETLEADDHGDALASYAANIAGSLAGIALFTLLSGTAAAPWAWMGAAGLFTLVGLRRSRTWARFAGLACVICTTAVVVIATRGSTWSPYQKITLGPIHALPERVVYEWELPRLSAANVTRLRELPPELGFTVRVNDDSYQMPIDLRDEAIAQYPALRRLRQHYDLPFMFGGRGHDVLILGAGTGNDVAGALRAGARHVDAVEIDSEILALGARHPEKPYSDPRVTVHNTDARSFLARTHSTYDEIVIGLVDSHVLLSATTPARLDSFVFTRESFQLAKRRLKPNGVLLVAHATATLWFYDRMRKTLTEAFDFKPPITITAPHVFGLVYAAGDVLPAGPPMAAGVTVLEDDWPFVYIAAPTVPREYVYAMLIMAAVAIIGVRGVSGKRFAEIDWHFFFLGVAFLLLETRGITVLAVNLGSTWLVSAAVFAAVLALAFAATLVGRRLARGRDARTVPWGAYGLLGVLVVVSFAVPVSMLASLPFALRAIISSLVVVLPLFASGMVFALSLVRGDSADGALASNLFGAMMGGLLEYLSMLMGFRMLILVAALFYLLALLCDVRVRAKVMV